MIVYHIRRGIHVLSGQCLLIRVRNAYTLSGMRSSEVVIKKSKFITISDRIDSREDVSNFLKQHCQSKATHNCYAYKLNDIEKTDDDGEVAGTAGIPILNAIRSHGFDNIIVLIIRYFGGIKLGKGGLYRAYGGCAREHLQATIESGYKIELVPICRVEFVINTDMLGIFYHVLSKYQFSQQSSRDIDAEGITILVYLIPTSMLEDLSCVLSQNRALKTTWSIVDDN